MANITPSAPKIVRGQGGQDGWQVTWGPMANGDVGLPVGSPIGDGAGAIVPSGSSGGFAGFADKSIQANGTFGAGGTVVCDASNDGTNFFAATNPTGTAVSLAAPTVPLTASGSAITEAAIMFRPRVSAGDGTTSLTVTMFFRKTQTP